MKKAVAILLSILLVTSFAPPAQAALFKDVPTSYSFHDEIEFLVEMEIIRGFEDGTFKPNQDVTRAQAAIMIGRALDLNGEQSITDFPDVPASSVASGYIQSAYELGIIEGFPDGKFKPDQVVSRGQLAILLSRAFDLTETEDIPFSDVSPNSAAYPYIGQLVYAEVTVGYPDGTFKPDQPVNRGQFSAFMTRTIIFIIDEYFNDYEDYEELDHDLPLDEDFIAQYKQ